MSYGKHWETMYTGSMYGVGLGVFAVWGYVIANTDMDHTIELNPQRLSDTLGCGVEQIETALTFLCAPDDSSRNKADQGARLVKIDAFRYFVVNHEAYRTMRNNDDRREYFRIKQQESRARKALSNAPVKLSNTHVNVSTQPETEPLRETAKQKPVQRSAARFDEFWSAYPVKKGRAAAEKSWRRHGCDAIADEILAHVQRMQAQDTDWLRGFIPHGSTYANGKGWLDEPKQQTAVATHAEPKETYAQRITRKFLAESAAAERADLAIGQDDDGPLAHDVGAIWAEVVQPMR